MSDEFRPLVDRERGRPPRVNIDLPQTARERLFLILYEFKHECHKEAFDRLGKRIGQSRITDHIDDDTDFESEFSSFCRQFFINSDTGDLLSYIELLFKGLLDDAPSLKPLKNMRIETMNDYATQVHDVLVTEGMLWQITPSESGFLEFQRIASEEMVEADKEVRRLTNSERWAAALKGYERAVSRFESGDFDEQIPRDLYHSVEEVLKTICVDLEAWTDNREQSHSAYLQLLRDRDVLISNAIAAEELGTLLTSMEKTIAKIGNDRKQRHSYIDRQYCTLLVHQVAAYLSFIIHRYEEFEF